ncbi:pimeloyl-ACP methyl ester esterase BioH [Algibacillus agarilyticus]|uniref:pimeloyl-ACP methyl ester esterase BioH n=1 Tax=Algibacillus agarilyticus TaxID=2234133 RepID=UPI0018E589A6|nr:pimeloyl-ACP methyl ester esterase BioH [Algibacillus agarilyticus]
MNNKPLIYLVHGWGMNQAVWQQTAEMLTAHFKIKCLDLAGFGTKSAIQLEPYDLPHLADELRHQIDEPGWIMGWSLGGLVAQHIAINNQSLVQGLITVASTPCFAEKSDWPGIKQSVLQSFQQQLANDYQITLARFLAIQTMGSPTAKQDIKTLKQQLLAYPEPHLSALTGGLVILEKADLRNDINKITCPTLRIYGRLDSLVPRKAIKKIQALQPNAAHHIFAHASHAPFISHIDEFIACIESYLSNLTLE